MGKSLRSTSGRPDRSAVTELLDLRGLSDMLARIHGRIAHRELDHVSPLAMPVMLEIGRESVYGEVSDELLAEAANELVKEATT
jgi:ATP-dependent Lhr-like helicase